ncbi:hypothetical protein C2W62_19085 [Candidatus Entotheonella serta]|nr:hypothetical protein C2W62_19085 [Candidatus Entotheonella serta]
MMHLTRGKALPPEVAKHIVNKTDGVPLYIEEMTKMLLASELLREESDQYMLTGPLSRVTIPDSLQDSLMARLDQMHTAKGIAQLGAVLGREFSYALLQAIASQDEETLRVGLTQLVKAKLLYQQGQPPRATYIFKHALIQDAAYESLLRRARQQAHRRIAQVLEQQFSELVQHQPELLGHHAMRGEEWEKALHYFRQAGANAMVQSAYQEAVVCYEQALSVLSFFSPIVTSGLAAAYALVERTADEQVMVDQGLELISTKRHMAWFVLVLIKLGEALLLLGHLEEAGELVARALSLARERKQRGVQAYVLRLLGDIARHRHRAESEQAKAHFQQAMALADELGMRPLQAHCHLGLGMITRQIKPNKPVLNCQWPSRCTGRWR